LENNTDKQKVEIIPALMPADFDELQEYAKEFAGVVPTVQVDVMDGNLVPPRSWPYATHDGSFKKIVAQEEGLPEWEKLDYEADLMIANPEVEAEKWIASGVKRIIFHIESIKDPESFFARDDISALVGNDFIELGLAIDIDTPNETLAPFIEKISFVQCMGIARIGYQGEEFDDRVLHKIEYFKKTYPGLIISVDGGVNMKTAGALVRAGASRLVSGSAILESDDSLGAIKELRQVAVAND